MKTFQVEVSGSQSKSDKLNILNMPNYYRKYGKNRNNSEVVIREGEITIKKEQVHWANETKQQQQQVDQVMRKVMLIVTDEREREKYQSEKFKESYTQSCSSIILSKIKDRYILKLADRKLDCFKYQDEKQQQKMNLQDKNLDARKRQIDLDKVKHVESKLLITKDPLSDDSSNSQNNRKKHKYDYLIQSDSEEPKKKVKVNNNSDSDS